MRGWVNRAFPLVALLLLLGRNVMCEETRTVKVGFPPIPGIFFYDNNGNRAGYYYEIIDHIAKARNWKLEFTDAPWNECLSLLSTGDIDLLGYTSRNPSQERLFTSNHETVTTSWVTILLKKGLAYKGIEDLKLQSIALVKGLNETTEFVQWMQSSDILMIPYYSDNSEQQIDLFKSGKTNAILLSSNLAGPLLKTNKFTDSGIIFNAESHGFSVREGKNQDLLDGIDEGLRNLKLENPAFLARLETKYLDLPEEYSIPMWLIIVVAALLVTSVIAAFFVLILQQQVRKHTAEIRMQKEKLEKKTTEVENANKELEAFAYSASHDLRAPVRAMSGFTALLIKENAGKLDEESSHFLTRIQESIVKMQSIIDALLQLSQVTRKALQFSPVDLSAIVRKISAELQEQHGKSRVATFIITEGLKAEGDGDLLKIALENILGNAWKYTGTCEKTIIEFGSHSESGIREYYIRDNGVGFDMAFVGKLFTPFQRLHTDLEFPGTGVGLATVKRIIERHEGKVWIESELGKGTIVRFTLGGFRSAV